MLVIKHVGDRVDVEVDELSSLSHAKPLSGAEITAVCREAAVLAMEENRLAAHVSRRHFLAALEQFRPRLTSAMMRFYEEYRTQCGVLSL